MPIPWQVDVHAQLPSTQDYLRDLANDSAPEGTVVQALLQAAGRGRQGREWVSPMGNLYMSALLRPDCPADRAGQVSFVAALAVSAAIDACIEPGHVKTVKWPNDILIDGKKCAGILIETSLRKTNVEWLIAGIGVNILAPPEGAIGLKDVCGDKPVPIHPFRDRLLEELDAVYHQWKHQGFAPIRHRWLKQAQGLGQTVNVRTAARQFSGIFRDMDENGALLVETDGGIEVVTSAESII